MISARSIVRMLRLCLLALVLAGSATAVYTNAAEASGVINSRR